MTDLVAAIRDRHTRLRERIDAVGVDHDVSVLAVTKVFGVDVAAAAREAGLTDFGENYAQELVAKAGELEATVSAGDVAWHMIGPIQRNKVKLLAGRVACYQSVDRAALVDSIATRDPAARIMIQVNPTGEPQKSGCAPDEVDDLVHRARDVGLDVIGLMTLGPTDAEVDPRPGFALVRAAVDRLDLRHASMGMSRDLDAAVAEGSTMVRVGTDLFGPRPVRPR